MRHSLPRSLSIIVLALPVQVVTQDGWLPLSIFEGTLTLNEPTFSYLPASSVPTISLDLPVLTPSAAQNPDESSASDPSATSRETPSSGASSFSTASLTFSPDSEQTVFPYSGSDAVRCPDKVFIPDTSKIGGILTQVGSDVSAVTLLQPPIKLASLLSADSLSALSLPQPSSVSGFPMLPQITTPKMSHSPEALSTAQLIASASAAEVTGFASVASNSDTSCSNHYTSGSSATASDAMPTTGVLASDMASQTSIESTETTSAEREATVTVTATTTVFLTPPWSNISVIPSSQGDQNTGTNILKTLSTGTLSFAGTPGFTASFSNSSTALPSSSNTMSVAACPKIAPLTTASQLSTAVSPITYRGFNVVNKSPINASYPWKSQADWNRSFRQLKALPGKFNAVRLYSTTDGDTNHLLNALPIARNHRLGIHAGVWSGGDTGAGRFTQEKAALDEVLSQLGCEGIVAVSVGNEDMYNRHRTDGGFVPLTDVMLLVNQTHEIMDVLDKHECCDIKVTHADTYGDWLDISFSEPLLRQVDFLTVNIFPYWQNTTSEYAAATFWRELIPVRDLAATYGKEVWIGETGWPVTIDPNNNKMTAAVPGTTQLRQYWQGVGCPLMDTMNAFWYAQWDEQDSPSFGLLDEMGNSKIGNISCDPSVLSI